MDEVIKNVSFYNKKNGDAHKFIVYIVNKIFSRQGA